MKIAVVGAVNVAMYVARCYKAKIATTLRGMFVVNENGMTNIPVVFAVGDLVSSTKTVV